MKHPCRTMCERDNKMVISRGGVLKGEEPLGVGGGGGLLWVSQHFCAARAFCDCPAIISHRPRSQNIFKEPQLNPEKDSRIKKPRSQVSLEKSSQNFF